MIPAGDVHPSFSLFDTDTFTVCPDNCTTQHISNNEAIMTDLIDLPFDVPMSSVGGLSITKQMGTMHLNIKDDQGNVHKESFPDTYYMPQSPKILISPTQWDEQINDDDDESTSITTFHHHSKFKWKGYTITFDHPPGSHLPEMPVNEGFQLHSIFSNKVLPRIHQNKQSLFCCSPCSNLVHSSPSSDDPTILKKGMETSDSNSSGFGICCPVPSKLSLSLKSNCSADLPSNSLDVWEPTFVVGDQDKYIENNEYKIVTITKIHLPSSDNENIPHYDIKVVGNSITFSNISEEYLHPYDSVDPSSIPSSENDIDLAQLQSMDITKDDLKQVFEKSSPIDPLQQELLEWHYRLGHTTFPTLIHFANEGIIPRQLRNVTRLPLCSSCLFGKSHHRPTRAKGKNNIKHIRKPTDNKPGKNTSIDHMISAQPGLIPQITGKLTLARFYAACIFVDHFSSYIYVHLCQGTTAMETREAKLAYERHCRRFDVDVLSYHGDNGRFAEKTFKNSCEEMNQSISFCGVGAHHQNGIAESAIKHLTLTARTLLLHAQTLWPEAIITMLWPYALKAASKQMNTIDLLRDDKTREQLFSGNDKNLLNAKDHHPFGCPVYVLDPSLQSGLKALPKWQPRARIGVYLGHSPQYAGNVAMVLNLTTGHVSPQFHVVFDDTFSTVPHMRKGTEPPNWKSLCSNHREQATQQAIDKATKWDFNDNLDIVVDTSSSSVAPQPLRSEKHVSWSDLEEDSPQISSNKGDPTNLQVQVSEGVLDSTNHLLNDSSTDSDLMMPIIRNLSTAGLRRST